MAEINAFYLQSDTIAKIKSAFDAAAPCPSVSLSEFFSAKAFAELKKIAVGNFQLQYEPLYRVARHKKVSPKILASKEFMEFINKFVKAQKIEWEIFSMGHKCYELRSDEQAPSVEIIITLADGNQHNGGIISYADPEGNSIELPPSENTLTIISKPKTVDRFITYINHHAGKERMVFLIGIVKKK